MSYLVAAFLDVIKNKTPRFSKKWGVAVCSNDRKPLERAQIEKFPQAEKICRAAEALCVAVVSARSDDSSKRAGFVKAFTDIPLRDRLRFFFDHLVCFLFSGVTFAKSNHSR